MQMKRELVNWKIHQKELSGLKHTERKGWKVQKGHVTSVPEE
jgi:hypothetical protein